MPWKTKSGSHYHMTEGCCGADIQCGTSGLEPCAICCGKAKGETAGAGGVGAAGGPTRESMEAADRWRRAATDALFNPGSSRGRRLSRREKEEAILAQMEADAELDAMIAAASSPDWDFDEMADDAFPFGDGGPYSLYGSSDSFPDWTDGGASQVAAPHSAPDAAPAGDFASTLAALTAEGTGLDALAAPPTPPMPGAPAPKAPEARWGDGTITIMSDGSIARESPAPDSPNQAARDRGNQLIRSLSRDLEESRGARDGNWDLCRTDAVAAIAKEAEGIDDDFQRDQMMLMAQRTWNAMHPEARILEWSPLSETYAQDSPLALMRRHRTYDEMRDRGYAGGVTYHYSIHSKLDGEDITQQVREARDAIRRAKGGVDEIDEQLTRDAQQRATKEWDDRFGEWLRGKQAESRIWRYHHPYATPDTRRGLAEEFRRDTGYERPARPAAHPTDEQRRERALRVDELRRAEAALARIREDHMLTDEMVRYADEVTTRLIGPDRSR